MLQSTQMLKSIWTPAFRPVMGDPPMRVEDLSKAVRKLFANGEQGGMWDFTNPAGLYQDASGTTPVTAVGQPVGLVLDRRFGLVKSLFGTIDSLVTEGTVFRDEAGIHIAGTGSIADNHARIDGLISGKTYELTLNYSAPNNNARPVLRGALGTIVPPVGASSRIFVASQGTIRVTCHAALATDATITEFSIRELPGNHLSQATTAARPTYTVEGAFHDGVDDKLSATDIGDWGFLVDGSGGLLGASGSFAGIAAQNYFASTQSNSANSMGISVGGYVTTAGSGSYLGSVVRHQTGVVISTNNNPPLSDNEIFSTIAITDGEQITGYRGSALYATQDYEPALEGTNPLSTGTSVTSVRTARRIIAISRVLTESEFTLVNAWLMEGVE